MFQPEDQRTKELIAEEYLGTLEDRLAMRDIALEMMGDIIFNIPAIQTANSHRGETTTVHCPHIDGLNLS